MDARTFLDTAEDLGLLDEHAIEAFATEHDLDEDEVAALRAELEARGVELVETTSDDDTPAAEGEQTRVRVTH